MNILHTRKQKPKYIMKQFILSIVILILGISVSSAQNSLIIKFEGNGVVGIAGMLPSEAYKAKDEILSKLQQSFLAFLVESAPNRQGVYKPTVAWIYLNDTKDPRDYHDVSDIESDYLGKIELFCINLSPRLRFILKAKGTKGLFDEIGVKYDTDENGDLISIIDYEKFEKFVY